jgi:uncharacterized membrane protein (Fun14 family)
VLWLKRLVLKRMVVDTVLTSAAGSLLLPTGGGAILGYVTAKALRFIAHIAMIILGIFVIALAYLSWRGWIEVKWATVAQQTQSAAYNASQQVMNAINNAASHLQSVTTTHPSLLQTEAMPLTIGAGFIGGLALGFSH